MKKGFFDIKYKVWLEKDGDIVIGMGKEKLLKEIEKTGSISAAARKLGLSYKKAWQYIKSMEKRLGMKLVKTKSGGFRGGGSQLTDEAKELLKEFDEILKHFEKTKKILEKKG